MNFDTDFYWHDSSLKNIQIDRTNPGNRDTIRLTIDWYDNGLQDMIFEDVYWARLNLNFGIVCNEPILTACVTDQDDIDLQALYKTWDKMGGLDRNLNCYVIEMNSTGSEIKIIAKGFRIEA